MPRLVSCSKCGRIHADTFDCTGGRRKYAKRKPTTATKVRDSARWKRTAREVKAAAFYMCELCYHTTGKANADQLEVHHIIPIEEDPELAYDTNNLICLCNACHRDAERGGTSRELLQDLAREREAGGIFSE